MNEIKFADFFEASISLFKVLYIGLEGLKVRLVLEEATPYCHFGVSRVPLLLHHYDQCGNVPVLQQTARTSKYY